MLPDNYECDDDNNNKKQEIHSKTTQTMPNPPAGTQMVVPIGIAT